MKKILLSVLFIVFSISNVYAQKITSSPATVDEINQYLPLGFQSELKPGEMILHSNGSLIILKPEDVKKYVTITKYSYNYKKNGKTYNGKYFNMEYRTDKKLISYMIGDYRSFSENGDGGVFFTNNYFGCQIHPTCEFDKAGNITMLDYMPQSGLCDRFRN